MKRMKMSQKHLLEGQWKGGELRKLWGGCLGCLVYRIGGRSMIGGRLCGLVLRMHRFLGKELPMLLQINIIRGNAIHHQY